MENEHSSQSVSRSTSPTHHKDFGSTPAQTEDACSEHYDTISVTSADEVSTTTTAFLAPQPIVPANTPATQSVVDGMTNLDLTSARDALAQLSAEGGPTSSEVSEPPTSPMGERMVRIGSGSTTKGEVDRVSTPKPKKEHGTSPPNDHVHEHSVWEEIAREDLVQALERAKQYALDMHRIDDTKAAKEYYGEMLADAIKEGDLEFDDSYLH